VDPDFVMFVMDREAAAEQAFDEKYPTCWAKFLHWLGVSV
jgi:hypothetical protein